MIILIPLWLLVSPQWLFIYGLIAFLIANMWSIEMENEERRKRR